MKHSLWVAALLGTVGTTGFAEQGQMSAGLGLSTVGPQLQLGYKYSNNIGFRGFSRVAFPNPDHKQNPISNMMPKPTLVASVCWSITIR